MTRAEKIQRQIDVTIEILQDARALVDPHGGDLFQARAMLDQASQEVERVSGEIWNVSQTALASLQEEAR